MRALILVYFALPIVAIILLVMSVQNMISTVSPVYNTAVTQIETAAAALDGSVEELQTSFRSLSNAVNTLRSGLRTVANFINNSVNAVINFVNRTPGINIPPFNPITIPPLVDLSFAEDMADEISVIGTQVGTVVTTTEDVLTAQAQTLGLIAVLFGLWFVMTYGLFTLLLLNNLGRR